MLTSWTVEKVDAAAQRLMLHQLTRNERKCHPADVARALNEARNATTARAREAEVLKQELARLRAGSNGTAAPAALDNGERQLHAPMEF